MTTQTATSPESTQPPPVEASRQNLLSHTFTSPGARALVALILVLVLGCVFNANGAFFRFATHRDTLREVSVYGILAVGMTPVIICAGIDLSVGSVLAFVAVIFALSTIYWSWAPYFSIPFSLAGGAACGIVCGLLITLFDMQPFIATLAMMVFARGLAKYVSGGMKISTAVQNPDGSYHYVPVPAIFREIDSRVLGGNISMVTVIFLVCAIVCWLLLAKHRWGRQLYAIGGNEEAARLSGVPVMRAKIIAYTLCGFLAAVAGICQAAQEQQGDPETGISYELTAIAIVCIGGTNLMGGRGGMGLTLLGMLTIGYLDKILSINAVPEAGRLMLTGVIIAVAVLAQSKRRT